MDFNIEDRKLSLLIDFQVPHCASPLKSSTCQVLVWYQKKNIHNYLFRFPAIYLRKAMFSLRTSIKARG